MWARVLLNLRIRLHAAVETLDRIAFATRVLLACLIYGESGLANPTAQTADTSCFAVCDVEAPWGRLAGQRDLGDGVALGFPETVNPEHQKPTHQNRWSVPCCS